MRTSALLLIVLLASCSTGDHWSYSRRTYYDTNAYANPKKLGTVQAESCQTNILYLFPSGKAANATDAIAEARVQRADTVFLADLTVEKVTRWRFLYSIECVVVTATAYTADPVEKR